MKEQEWYKRPFGKVLITIIVVCFLIIVLVSLLPETEKPEAIPTVLKEFAKNPQFEGKTVAEICWDIDGRLCEDKYQVERNPFGDGYVVYGASAIWLLREGTVYPINGIAKNFTPHLDYLKGEESNKILNKYVDLI